MEIFSKKFHTLHFEHFATNYLQLKVQNDSREIIQEKGNIKDNNMINVSEILDIINSVLKISEITEEDINKELADLGVTSIMYISIVIAIEEKYSIVIPDEYLLTTEIGTVKKIHDVVL